MQSRNFPISCAILLALLAVAQVGAGVVQEEVAPDVAQNTVYAVYYNVDNPDRCTVSATEILHPGETAKDPAGCGRLQCLDEQGNVSIVRCIEEAPPPANCQLGEPVNPRSLYPSCCERTLTCTQ